MFASFYVSMLASSLSAGTMGGLFQVHGNSSCLVVSSTIRPAHAHDPNAKLDILSHNRNGNCVTMRSSAPNLVVLLPIERSRVNRIPSPFGGALLHTLAPSLLRYAGF